jgi:predicted nuclease of predicted toxin-antitoxin system
MRFLANENFPLPSVRLLQEKGYDIASTTEDSPGIEDTEVLARAADEQRVILTFDRDYGELVYRLRLLSPKGVIYLRFRPTRQNKFSIVIAEFILEGRIAICSPNPCEAPVMSAYFPVSLFII